MTGRERIVAAIRAANADERVAVCAFLTAGYPSPEAFAELLAAVRAAADVVEIGVPFSDPMADGVTIQRSSRLALEHGVHLDWILDTARRSGGGAPLLLMSYLNPLLAYGLARLVERAVAGGVAGLIVPDLPLDESGALGRLMDPAGLALVQLVSPATAPPRRRALCRAAGGFVYAVTVNGITGDRLGLSPGLAAHLRELRAEAAAPVLAGFGVRRPEQVDELAAHVDGVIVGSALIDSIDRGEDVVALIESLKRPRPRSREAAS